MKLRKKFKIKMFAQVEMLGQIEIKGLKVFAYHGVNPEEKRDGQTFIVDIKMTTDMTKASETDAISDTTSYAAVRKTITRVLTEKTYNLIEKAANEICEAVLAEYSGILEVKVRLKKPEAPMQADFKYVAVTLKRKR